MQFSLCLVLQTEAEKQWKKTQLTELNVSYEGSPGRGGFTTTSITACPDTDEQSLAETDFTSIAFTPGSKLMTSE